MQPLSIAKHNHIVELLHSGTSTPAIHNQTGASLGAISKIRSEYCPDIPRSSSGRPRKLTPANV